MTDIGHNSVDGDHLRTFVEKVSVADIIKLVSEREIWRRIDNYPEYEASSHGRVRRVSSGRILKHGSVYGYPFVSLCHNGKNKTRRINIIIAEAFLGQRPFQEAIVAHNDGDKTNNLVSNLRWASATDNQGDCVRHGTRIHGSDVHCAKLAESDIPTIRVRIASGERYPDIAADYGVSVSTISLIKKGRVWKRALGASWRPSL